MSIPKTPAEFDYDLWTTEENARSLATALDAMGASYEDIFYMTPEEFGARVLNGEMLECTEFNKWFYGTSYEALRSDCINIGVFNPAGVESMLHFPDIKVKVFYITASDKTRLLRQLNRESNPDVREIIRRYTADEIDFEDLSDIPHTVIVNEGSLAETAKEILAQIN